MSTTINTTTDAYADYVAVVVNGARPSDRARDRGIAPATVSANVRRIRDAIANGATIDGATVDNADGTTSGVTVDVPSFYAWVATTHGDDAADAVSMFDDHTASINNDRARAIRVRDAADARVTACDTAIDRAVDMFGRMAPDTPTPDALRDAYNAHADAMRADATPDA